MDEEPLNHLTLADTKAPVDAQLIEKCMQAMEAGSTLNAVALQAGTSPATVWTWIQGDADWQIRYENAKIARSRALMEHALYEMQTANTLDDAKMAEKKAKMYIMHAARLNPREFSERVQAAMGKQAPAGGRLSFTLVFPGSPTQDMGELRVIPQPEDGELP